MPTRPTTPPSTDLPPGTRTPYSEPDRCLSVSWIFRCGKPVGHDGEHLAGKVSWGRRAEDRWRGEYPVLCRDLRDLGDRIEEEAEATDG